MTRDQLSFRAWLWLIAAIMLAANGDRYDLPFLLAGTALALRWAVDLIIDAADARPRPPAEQFGQNDG